MLDLCINWSTEVWSQFAPYCTDRWLQTLKVACSEESDVPNSVLKQSDAQKSVRAYFADVARCADRVRGGVPRAHAGRARVALQQQCTPLGTADCTGYRPPAAVFFSSFTARSATDGYIRYCFLLFTTLEGRW
jgi:hypothetical protein